MQEFLVEPNIDMLASDQEAPAWRQAKEWHCPRARLLEMHNVYGLKEIGGIRKLLSAPDEPTTGTRLGLMTETVERLEIGISGET